jgi:hypothetical protein
MHESDGAFPLVFSLDTEDFKWAEPCRQLRARDNPDVSFRFAAQTARRLLYLVWHEGSVLYQATGASGALHRHIDWLT